MSAIAAVLLLGVTAGCTSDEEGAVPDPHEQPGTMVGEWVEATVSEIQIGGVSPPPAGRLLAYTNLALYEALAASPDVESLSGAIDGLPTMDEVDEEVAWPIVAGGAAATTAEALLVADTTAQRMDALLAMQREELADEYDEAVLDRSEELGRAFGEEMVAWSETDGYAESADDTFAGSDQPGSWVRTAPAFAPPLEPGWGTLRTMLVDVGECPVAEPLPYSEEPGSPFYEQAMAVYEADQERTDEQREIARFWNMEPATGTPAGHWARIARTVSDDLGLDLVEAAHTQAVLSTAVADSLVAGWGAKFETDVLRPITFIQEHIDPTWLSYLTTPQFPEYPSGHSFLSGTAAATLTALLGPQSFVDDSNNDGITREFESFDEAALEAASSRLYGGVHYPMGIEGGNAQGQCIGELAVERIEEAGG